MWVLNVVTFEEEFFPLCYLYHRSTGFYKVGFPLLMWSVIADLNVHSEDTSILSWLFAFLYFCTQVHNYPIRRTGANDIFDWLE